MSHHFNIACKSKNIKAGFAFDVYKFATEQNIRGEINYDEKNSCEIQVEGSSNSIAAFIAWFCTKEIDNELTGSINITGGRVRHYSVFTISNQYEE